MIQVTIKDDDIKGVLKELVIYVDPSKYTESQVYRAVSLAIENTLHDWWDLRKMSEGEIYGEE